jgi:hypothetical protein
MHSLLSNALPFNREYFTFYRSHEPTPMNHERSDAHRELEALLKATIRG